MKEGKISGDFLLKDVFFHGERDYRSKVRYATLILSQHLEQGLPTIIVCKESASKLHKKLSNNINNINEKLKNQELYILEYKADFLKKIYLLNDYKQLLQEIIEKTNHTSKNIIFLNSEILFNPSSIALTRISMDNLLAALKEKELKAFLLYINNENDKTSPLENIYKTTFKHQ